MSRQMTPALSSRRTAFSSVSLRGSFTLENESLNDFRYNQMRRKKSGIMRCLRPAQFAK